MKEFPAQIWSWWVLSAAFFSPPPPPQQPPPPLQQPELAAAPVAWANSAIYGSVSEPDGPVRLSTILTSSERKKIMFGAIEKIQRRRSYSLERLWWREWGRGGGGGTAQLWGWRRVGGFSPPAAAIVAEWQCGAIVCSGALITRSASLKFATRYTRKTRHSAFNPATVPIFESALWVSGRAILSGGGGGGFRWLPPSLPRHPEIKIHSEMRDENVSFVFFFRSIFPGASSVRIPSAPCLARPDLMCCPLPLLPWSGLMCDTDQQCQSPAAVTPVSPKARQKPLILVISHPSSPLSLPPCSVTWHSGSLCPVTLLVCVCARPCTLECSRSGQPGPLSHENRSISVPLAHLFLSFSCPRLPSFNTLHYEQVLL